MKKTPVLALFLTSISACTNGSDGTSAPASPGSTPQAGGAELISVNDPKAKRFMAVGRFNSTIGVGSQCTATLIAYDNRPDPDSPALILTAGHCISGPPPIGDNEVVIDRPMPPGWQFTPAYFYDNQADHVPVPVKRIVFASMKETDIGVLELDETYGNLKQRNIEPLLLTNPDASTHKIDMAHIPTGFNAPGPAYLKYSSCEMTSAQPIFEGTLPIREDQPWYWSTARPDDCKGTAVGSSGAPVFKKDGASVIGVHFNAAAISTTGCGYGRPCELTRQGLVIPEERAYFNSVDLILAALRSDSTLDLSKLDPGTGVGLIRTASWSSRSQVADASGVLHPARWDLEIDQAFEHVRIKTGPAGFTHCEQSKGYGDSLRAADQPLLKLPVDPKEGVQVICVIGQKKGATAWQSERHATIKLRRIDDTAPTVTPDITAFDSPDSWSVFSQIRPSEIVTTFIKYGPLASTDCKNPEGFVLQPAQLIELPKDRDWRFCTFGQDDAGNQSPTVSREFTRR